MVRLANNGAGISPGLLFALLGSVLLHAGVLSWGSVTLPAGTGAPHAIEARLVPAAPAEPVAAATHPVQPQAHEAARKVERSITPDTALALPVASETAKPEITEAKPETPETSGEPPAVPQPAAVSADAGLSAPAYYPGGQLDESPRLLGELKRDYPARARDAGIEGYVTLLLLINERGELDEIHVVKAQPAGYFEESAIAMLRGHHFTPGIRQGKAVRSSWQQTVRFRLRD